MTSHIAHQWHPQRRRWALTEHRERRTYGLRALYQTARRRPIGHQSRSAMAPIPRTGDGWCGQACAADRPCCAASGTAAPDSRNVLQNRIRDGFPVVKYTTNNRHTSQEYHIANGNTDRIEYDIINVGDSECDAG